MVQDAAADARKLVRVPSGFSAANIADLLTEIERARSCRDRVITPLDLTEISSKQLDPAIDVVMQTSGSGGRGKLVGLSWRALEASVAATHAYLGGPGRWVLALDPSHIAGFQVVLRAQIAGIKPVIGRGETGFNPEQLARALSRAARTQDPVYLSLVPTQLGEMLASPWAKALKLADAILIGGAHLNEELAAKAAELDLAITTTYGMTETCGGCVYNGEALAGAKISIRQGRVHLAGPMLMEGYLDGDSCPLVSGEDGTLWFPTQDRGVISDGKLQILGRSDDVLNSGGLKIDANQVAALLQSHPAVTEVAVIGTPDPLWGELVTAAVILTPGIAFDQQLITSLRRLVSKTLGRAAAPRVIFELERLPLLGIGKVDRGRLSEMAAQAIMEKKAWVR